MKKSIAFAIAGVAMVSALNGCSYGAVAHLGGERVILARNDNILFGLLRKVYVCRVTDAGVSACQSADAP